MTEGLIFEAIWTLHMNSALKASAAEEKEDVDAFDMALLKNIYLNNVRGWFRIGFLGWISSKHARFEVSASIVLASNPT